MAPKSNPKSESKVAATPPKKKPKISTASPALANGAQSTLSAFFKSPNGTAGQHVAPPASKTTNGTNEVIKRAASKTGRTGKRDGRDGATGTTGVIELDLSSEEEAVGVQEAINTRASAILSGSAIASSSKLASNGLLDDPFSEGIAPEDVDMVSISSDDSDAHVTPDHPAYPAAQSSPSNGFKSTTISPARPKHPLAPIFQRKRKASRSPSPSGSTIKSEMDVKPSLPERDDSDANDKPIQAINFPSAFGAATKMVGLQHSPAKVEHEPGLDPLDQIDGMDTKHQLTELPSRSTGKNTGPSTPIDFDTDPLVFRPDEMDVRWWPGGKLPYEVLVGVYVAVGGTRSRLAIGRVLTNFLRLLIYHSPQDLLPTIYLLSNHLSPSYISLELGIGSQVLTKTIKEVSGITPERMKSLWAKWGDPGDVAFEAKSTLRTLVRPSPLTAGKVYEELVKIAETKGTGGQKGKGEIVRRLLVQAKGEEVRYLVRTLCAHLRIGAVKLTLLSALARAFVLTRTPGCTNGLRASEHHASLSELSQVHPIPVKTKGKGKAKVELDAMREIVEVKMLQGIATLRRVYARHPNYEDILAGLLEGGLDDLSERVPLSVGIPLSPMLGSITRSLAEVFTRLGNLPFTSEAKLDGQRVQIHARTTGPSGKDDGGGKWVESKLAGKKIWVRLFSRHLEDMTEKYPDVNAMVACLIERSLPARRNPFSDRPELSSPNEAMLQLIATEEITSFVMDAEVVAIDKDDGSYRTFQELSNRAKKDVKIEDVKVIVGVFAFDLMLINDVPLLHQPFSIRRHLLRTLFPAFLDKEDPMIARFGHVEFIDSTKPDDVQSFFEQVISQKCEGLMVKLLESGEGIAGDDEEDDDVLIVDGKKAKKSGGNGNRKPLPSTYEPDARSQGWLKVKKDYLEGMGDSLDLVPIGAWHGLGRKAGWWSPILLACLNPDTGALEAVCKCISGFTDQFYKDLLVRYPPEGNPEMTSTTGPLAYVETGGYRPDIYFAPTEVWEIRGADISLSPVYPAAASHLGSERGLSMRFPRFIRLRDDKGWEDATTSAQFADMYRKQIAAAPPRPAMEPTTEDDGRLASGPREELEEGDGDIGI